MQRTLRSCPICLDGTVRREERLIRTDSYRVTCSRCGSFEVTDEFIFQRSNETLTPQRVALSGIIRHWTDLHGEMRETIKHNNADQIVGSSGAPTSVDGQIDELLLTIARLAPYFGDRTPLQSNTCWVARAYLPNESNLKELIGVLQADGLLNAYGGMGDDISFSLALAGWRRVHDIRSRVGAGNQAFVAMWFHEGMNDVYDDGIFPALKVDCGLAPFRVDRQATTNKIDDEIIAQIRRSKLLVAEVTGERPSVYYEAGFAHGLDIPVIWCCNESWEPRLPVKIHPQSQDELESAICHWKDRVHFDVRQFHHIFWRTTVDLRRQLSERIQALAIDMPQS